MEDQNCEKCKRLLKIIENLVGGGPMDKVELEKMEILLRSSEAPLRDRTHAIDAVHVLLEEQGQYEQ